MGGSCFPITTFNNKQEGTNNNETQTLLEEEKKECKCTLFHKFTNCKHKHKTNYKLPQIFNIKKLQKTQNTHELFIAHKFFFNFPCVTN
jgi:hypothetical protein